MRGGRQGAVQSRLCLGGWGDGAARGGRLRSSLGQLPASLALCDYGLGRNLERAGAAVLCCWEEAKGSRPAPAPSHRRRFPFSLCRRCPAGEARGEPAPPGIAASPGSSPGALPGPRRSRKKGTRRTSRSRPRTGRHAVASGNGGNLLETCLVFLIEFFFLSL